MAEMAEIREKERLVREWLDARGLKGVLLSRQSNFAWATCGGDNHIAVTSETGSGSVLFIEDRKYLICNEIEERRLQEEELVGQGFESVTYPWFHETLAEKVRDLCEGGPFAADTAIERASLDPDALTQLIWQLTPHEMDRYRSLGADCARIMGEVARTLNPGVTEHEIAARIAAGFLAEGILPAVVLVAADERIQQYRHPIPTGKRLSRHCMLVSCGKRSGLILSHTRFMHFGKAPDEIQRRHRACTRVDAAFILSTRTGATSGDVFRAGMDAYAETGWPEEWRLHHQGGAAGYEARYYRAGPDTSEPILANQAFAWNPSITGTKSEDTVILTEESPEIISETPGWPTSDAEWDGRAVPRPDILIL